MFKICVAVILQILQFSTDERTLEAMKGISGSSGKDSAMSQVREDSRQNEGLFPASCDAILILPKKCKANLKTRLAPHAVQEMTDIKVVFA